MQAGFGLENENVYMTLQYMQYKQSNIVLQGSTTPLAEHTKYYPKSKNTHAIINQEHSTYCTNRTTLKRNPHRTNPVFKLRWW